MLPNEEDILIRDMARQFAQERLKPFAADWDREHRFPAEAIAEMGQLGFMGMLVPQQWGVCGEGPRSVASPPHRLRPAARGLPQKTA